jgi:hypothetical protein
LKTSTYQAFVPFDRDRGFRIVTGDSGLSPKSVTIDRNCRSRSNGIVGHVRPEIPVTMVRNSHEIVECAEGDVSVARGGQGADLQQAAPFGQGPVTKKSARWGQLENPTDGYFDHEDPQLSFFKSGYYSGSIANDPAETIRGTDKPSRRKSDWNERSIELAAFKGTIDEYAEHIASRSNLLLRNPNPNVNEDCFF